MDAIRCTRSEAARLAAQAVSAVERAPLRRAGTGERWAEIMGIDWPMTQHELREAIPPAYTEWIGAQLLASGAGS